MLEGVTAHTLCLAVLCLVTLTLLSAPAAADSLDARTYSYDGEVYSGDDVEFEIALDNATGADGPVAVFVDENTEYVYFDGLTQDNDGNYTGSVSLDGLTAGTVRAVYLHPNDPDGEFGDGEFEWAETSYGPEPADVVSLDAFLAALSDDDISQDFMVQQVLDQTVEADGSTDLVKTDDFTLSDEASVEVQDLGVGDPDGIEDVSPGADVVVRGTTNLAPENRHIEVRLSNGPTVAEGSDYQDVNTETEISWGHDGVWEVDLYLPEDLGEGQYEIEAFDADVLSVDTVQFTVEQTTGITDCGFTATSSGVYEIQANLTSSTNCITVDDTEDVVIDGSGHEIQGDSPGIVEYGVHVINSVNVTVRDVVVTGWDDSAGVVFDSSDSGTVSDARVLDNGVGVRFENSYDGSLTGSFFEGNGEAFELGGGVTEAEEVTLADSGGSGVTVSFESEHVEVSPTESPPDNPDAVPLEKYVDATGDDPDAYFDVAFHYDSDDLGDVDEDTLSIWRNDGSGWEELSNSEVLESSEEVEASVDEFSTFGVFGNETSEESSDSDGSDDSDDTGDDGDDSDDSGDDSGEDGSTDGSNDSEDGSAGDGDDGGSEGDDEEDGGSGEPRMPGFGVFAAFAALSLFALVRLTG